MSSFRQNFGVGFISEPLLIRPLSSNATSLEVKKHQYLSKDEIHYIFTVYVLHGKEPVYRKKLTSHSNFLLTFELLLG